MIDPINEGGADTALVGTADSRPGHGRPGASHFEVPNGVGTARQQEHALCLDVYGRGQEDLEAERDAIATLVLSDDPILDTRLFVPGLAIPTFEDWLIARGLLIEQALNETGGGSQLFFRGCAPKHPRRTQPRQSGGIEVVPTLTLPVQSPSTDDLWASAEEFGQVIDYAI
jgi:hypothetical protein